jgi:hypothetical protein
MHQLNAQMCQCEAFPNLPVLIAEALNRTGQANTVRLYPS